MPDHIDVKQDQSGAWYWVRIDSGNNEPLSKSSESYDNKSHAIEQAYALNQDVDDVRVPE